MSDTNRTALIILLVERYDDFKQRLTRRTGSAALAIEALQDTFLRLSNASSIGPVRDLHAYLFRVAMSTISNRRVAERRRVIGEAGPLLELPDEMPSPERIVEARSEIHALKRIIQELPTRRREIFIAICVDESPLQQVAERFGVSVRTVQVELKQVLVHCAARLNRNARMPSALYKRRPCFRERDHSLRILSSENDAAPTQRSLFVSGE